MTPKFSFTAVTHIAHGKGELLKTPMASFGTFDLKEPTSTKSPLNKFYGYRKH